MSAIEVGDLVEVVGVCCKSQQIILHAVSNVTSMRAGAVVECPDCGSEVKALAFACIQVPCIVHRGDHMAIIHWPVHWLRKIEPPKQMAVIMGKQPLEVVK